MPFKKGQSGNPGGRPKKGPAVIEIEALAKQLSPEALERLAAWMRSGDAKASVSACQAIINRGFGTPAQTINATVTDERNVLRAPETADDPVAWQATNKPH